MTGLAVWALLPFVLGALSLGCGLLLEAAVGRALPGALLLPAGFALVVVASQFPALLPATAPLAPAFVAGLAGAGLVLAAGRRAWRPDVWPAVAGVAAYAAYALPTVLSGRATFAGYIKLDDTATYLAMLDRVETHGRVVGGLPPSSHEATLATSLAYGYPLGSFAPLGIVRRLVGVDAAWLWQPYLAFLGGLLALALYAVAGRLVADRRLRTAVAVVAAQPAILFGYSLWGGIKELATAGLLALLAACVPVVLRSDDLRAVVALATAGAAILGVLSVGGAPWLVLLVPALALVLRRHGTRFAVRAAGAFLVATAVLAVPPIVAALEWLPRSDAFTGETQLGNLAGPLDAAQIAGVWPSGDFRRAPAELGPTYALIAVVCLAAAGGVFWAWARGAWSAVLYGLGAVLGAVVLFGLGSPWIGAKALAIASPAFVLFALAGAAALATRGRRVEAAVVAIAVAGGVVWSNVLAYREAWLAPRSRLAELEAIGERFAGRGPALMTEFEPYGVRHFLRRLDAEGTSELRRRVVPLRTGAALEPQAYADVDAFRLDGVLVYRTLVLRRSPVASRPPSAYRLAARGRWYEVWERDGEGARVLRHLPLGDDLDATGVPRCADVLRLARSPGTSRLVASLRPGVVVAPLAAFFARDSREVAVDFRIPARGRWDVWVGGTFLGRVTVAVDGRPVGSARHELQWSGQFVPLGRAPLARGLRRVALRYEAGGWRPGSTGVAPFELGPVVLARADAADGLVSVAPAEARSLCGRRLDWIEAVA